MINFVQRPKSNRERFANAFGAAAQEGAKLIPEELLGKKERQSLSGLIGKDVSDIRDPKMLQSFLDSALSQENQYSKLKGNYEADEENFKKIKEAFGEKFADVWLASGQGERTLLTKAALDAKSRGIDLDEMLGFQEKQQSPQQEMQPQQKNPEEKVFDEIKDIKSQQDEGLLPAEKIARGKERYDTGLKKYEEASTKLEGMARDKERLDILEHLEKSKKLPKGLGRLNIDKEGNLRAAFLASPEAQRFVKTLNEFSSGAKNTFGSRVTNFDLTQYLKRFPTLLNSSEGRRQLVDQMRIVNKINSVYYKNLKNVYDRAGGVRNIDADVAQRLAEEISESKIEKLAEQFKEVGEFSSKPAASEFKGRRIVDEGTGEIFVSDGENWIPEGQ